MKNLLLLIAILFVTQIKAQKQTQIIFNEVPIHFSYDNDIDDFWENPRVMIERFDRQLNNEAMPIKEHYALIHYIMENIKTGKIKIYEPDLFTSHISPEEFFKTPLSPNKEIDSNYYSQNALSDSYLIERFDEWTGDYMYDEVTGEPIYKLIIEPILESDFVSFTFVEEWEFDTKNNIMLKKVLGFTANTFRIGEMGERRGIIPRFYVKLNEYSKSENNWKIANNFIAKSRINGKSNAEKNELQQYWWDNNLEYSKRYSFIQPLFSGQLNYLEPRPPFNKAISDKNKALFSFEKYEVFDEEYYDFMYDENGDIVTALDSTLYSYLDIEQIGFVEDWYFDTINNAFGKEVKGIMPYINDFDETGEVVGTRPLFLVNSNGANIEFNISNFKLKTYVPSLLLVNNKVENLNFLGNKHLVKINSLEIDSTLAITINSSFIEKAKTKEIKLYARDYDNDYQLAENTTDLLNITIVVPRLDAETDDELYDAETGDLIFDSILMPYEERDIIGFRFIENWEYNVLENKFNNEITGTIPMIWRLNTETGDIVGEKELYMKKSNNNQDGEFVLIKSNHVHTENLINNYAADYWNYQTNKDWLYSNETKNLIESLFEGAKSKKVEIFDLYTNKEVIQKDKELLFEEVNFYDIKSIQFEEDIYFNYSTLDFKKEVKSVTLIKYFDEYFETYDEPWIKIVFEEK